MCLCLCTDVEYLRTVLQHTVHTRRAMFDQIILKHSVFYPSYHHISEDMSYSIAERM